MWDCAWLSKSKEARASDAAGVMGDLEERREDRGLSEDFGFSLSEMGNNGEF